MYRRCALLMRTMFHTCRLVHADLSEYNLLWYKKRLHVIDVSQSVEHDHPRALDFLRMDCKNVTGAWPGRCQSSTAAAAAASPARRPSPDYFSRQQVAVLRPRALFEFVCTMDVDEEVAGVYLDRLLATSGNAAEPTHEEQVSDQVFMQSFIPRTLDEVEDVEKEHTRLLQGEREGRVFHALTGLRVRTLPHPRPPAADSSRPPSRGTRRRSERTAESGCSVPRRRRSVPCAQTPVPTAGARAAVGRATAGTVRTEGRGQGTGTSGEKATAGNCRSRARR